MIPSEYFGDTSVGNLKESGDVARAGTRMSQFDDPLSGGIRKGPSIDVDSTQLIHAAVPCINATI